MSWRKCLPTIRWALPLLILAAPIPVLGLLVRPILLDLKTTGSQTSGSFEVSNDRNRPITVEVAVNRLAVPEKGEVVLTKDDGADFQIFPPIASIQPGKKQVFRVKWIGDPQLAESQLYMFTTAELPVARTETAAQSSVQILYAINSVVAVAPSGKEPLISVAGIERKTTADGRKGIEITFVNAGAAHGYVNNAELALNDKSANWSKQIQASDVSNAFGLGLVPAFARRTMFIPVTDVPEAGELGAEFRLLSERGISGR